MSFKAEIVADSKNEFGNRITTFVVTFPRIILAEFNTHRMLSRNSASSRAIPFEKMVKAVEENPFIPIAWMKDHKGMQGNEFFDENDLYSPGEGLGDVWTTSVLTQRWKQARDGAVYQAKKLAELGLTKQIVNRLLETYMWHTCIVTGTEWENFFALRAHKDAEIHMQKIAYMMLEEYNKSIPKLLKAGEWHIPYEKQIEALLPPTLPIREGLTLDEGVNEIKVKLSTVMGGRTSYTVVGTDQKPMTWDRMVELHDQMKSAFPKHMSPLEHPGQSPNEYEFYNNVKHFTIPVSLLDEYKSKNDSKQYFIIFDPRDSKPDQLAFNYALEANEAIVLEYGWFGNFRGFKQYRKMIEGENANDNRVIKK
jgi:hypothetical protein